MRWQRSNITTRKLCTFAIWSWTHLFVIRTVFNVALSIPPMLEGHWFTSQDCRITDDGSSILLSFFLSAGKPNLNQFKELTGVEPPSLQSFVWMAFAETLKCSLNSVFSCAEDQAVSYERAKHASWFVHPSMLMSQISLSWIFFYLRVVICMGFADSCTVRSCSLCKPTTSAVVFSAV